MDGSKRAADPSIYALCPLIQNIDFGTEEEKDRTEIRCVAALGECDGLVESTMSRGIRMPKALDTGVLNVED